MQFLTRRSSHKIPGQWLEVIIMFFNGLSKSQVAGGPFRCLRINYARGKNVNWKCTFLRSLQLVVPEKKDPGKSPFTLNVLGRQMLLGESSSIDLDLSMVIHSYCKNIPVISLPACPLYLLCSVILFSSTLPNSVIFSSQSSACITCQSRWASTC